MACNRSLLTAGQGFSYAWPSIEILLSLQDTITIQLPLTIPCKPSMLDNSTCVCSTDTSMIVSVVQSRQHQAVMAAPLKPFAHALKTRADALIASHAGMLTCTHTCIRSALPSSSSATSLTPGSSSPPHLTHYLPTCTYPHKLVAPPLNAVFNICVSFT